MAKDQSMAEFELVSPAPSQTTEVPRGRKGSNSMAEFELISAAPAAPPKPPRTWSQIPGEAFESFIPSAQRFLGGVYETITKPVETLTGLGEVLTGAYARFIPQEWMARPDKAQEFIEKANAVGGAYKDRYGSVEALKNTIATDPVGFAADVSMFTGAGAAVTPGRTGQVLGTVSRYTDPLRVSGILPTAEILGGASVKGLSTISRGAKTNLLMESVEGRAPEVINALRQQRQYVPGSAPTAGEVVAEIGMQPGVVPLTRYAALQESATKVLPSEYLAREQAQEAARLSYIRNIGGSDPASQFVFDAANKLRANEAKMLYGKAGTKVVLEDATLQTLKQRPSMQKAFDLAERLAKEEGVTFGSIAPTSALAQPGARGYLVADMHYVKQALDDMIKDPAAAGIAKTEAKLITNTRQQFLNWLEKNAPEYKTARESFAARSKPITQMEIGEFLEKKLVGARGEERPGVFAGAVKEAPTTIKRATGQTRFEKLSEVLTPDQVKIVKDIQADLNRQLALSQQATAARQTGPAATRAGSELLEAAFGGVAAPNVLNAVITATNAILRRLGAKIDRKVALQIATEMLDPQQAAAALEQAQRRASAVEAVERGVRAAGGATGRALTPISTIQNRLVEGQNQNALAR